MSLVPRKNNIAHFMELHHSEYEEISTIAPYATPELLAKWKLTNMKPSAGFKPLVLTHFGIFLQAFMREGNALDIGEIDFEYSDDNTNWVAIASITSTGITYSERLSTDNPIQFINSVTTNQDEYYFRLIFYRASGANDTVYARQLHFIALIPYPSWAKVVKLN